MVALKHLKSKAVSLQAFAPDVSSATAYVINRTLHKDPDQRYQSYAELIEHLEYAKAQLMEATSGPRKANLSLLPHLWYDHQNLRDERAEAFSSLVWGGVYNGSL